MVLFYKDKKKSPSTFLGMLSKVTVFLEIKKLKNEIKDSVIIKKSLQCQKSQKNILSLRFVKQ
jgi:hypothetical protein